MQEINRKLTVRKCIHILFIAAFYIEIKGSGANCQHRFLIEFGTVLRRGKDGHVISKIVIESISDPNFRIFGGQ